jgi:hypothetical protein
VRHPSSIVADGFIYVFYLDTGDSRTNQAGLPTQGAGAGIAVARAPAVLSGSSQSFETYAGDGHWESSLPRGFASADAPAFFSRPGPTAAQILGSQRGSYYFAVARTGEAHPAYIGVEDYSEASSPSCAAGEFAHKEALWESDDLVSWRDRTDISQLTSCGATAGDAYNRAPLRWAHFLNADGSDQNTVDPSAFNLIGTCGACGNTGVGLVRLTISP